MPPDRLTRVHHFEALGTHCSLLAVDRPAERLLEAEAWVQAAGARLTRFSESSELSALNRSAGRWIEVGPLLEAVLRAALLAYESSFGLVNAAVLPSMIAIGYVRPLRSGPGTPAGEPARPLPALPDVLDVRPGGARVRTGCGVDLGGLAKGWMADRLCEVLGGNVVANLGGDLMAAGPGPRGEGWPVGFAGTTVALRDQGAATSSVRKRRWSGVHHLIDPRTGRSSSSGVDEVSVVAESGLAAEVVAKTALLLGPELAPLYCASNALAWCVSESHDG